MPRRGRIRRASVSPNWSGSSRTAGLCSRAERLAPDLALAGASRDSDPARPRTRESLSGRAGVAADRGRRMKDKFDGFAVNLLPDEEGAYTAHFVELPEVSAFGDTPEVALRSWRRHGARSRRLIKPASCRFRSRRRANAIRERSTCVSTRRCIGLLRSKRLASACR